MHFKSLHFHSFIRSLLNTTVWRLTDVSSADGACVVDFKAVPSLTSLRHIFQVLHTSMVQSADVRERVATVL